MTQCCTCGPLRQGYSPDEREVARNMVQRWRVAVRLVSGQRLHHTHQVSPAMRTHTGSVSVSLCLCQHSHHNSALNAAVIPISKTGYFEVKYGCVNEYWRSLFSCQWNYSVCSELL